MADFFVSYTQADRPWAEWITWTLEEAGYTAVIQAWDFRPGGNFVVEMHRAAESAERTLAVLSPDYLGSLYATAEWAAAFAQDPDGSRGKLLPVRVRAVQLSGLLAAVVAIDLVGLDTGAAREKLLAGLARSRAKPQTVPSFPGVPRPGFPGAPAAAEPESAARLADLPEEEIPAPGPLPAGSRMPLAVNPLFTGRQDDLRSLARHLKTAGTPATVAATGLGGIGKTQLAAELAHRYGRFFAGGVFWLRFADPAGVPAEVAACGLELSLHPGSLHPSYARLPLEEQVRLVLAAWQGPVSRLLIFDNCEDESLLDAWRPRSGGARVLLTSRRATWDPALGVAAVALPPLQREASRALLRRFRPDLPADTAKDPALDGIAAALGDLPLALHLAGGFLARYAHAPFGQPAVYLASLLKSGLSHPSLGGTSAALSPTGHEAHVGRTFALSFERLAPADATDAQAIALLARAACFAAGEPIPRDLLLKSVLGEGEGDGDDFMALTSLITAEDALSRLTSLGLLDLGVTGALVIHRLVAAFVHGVIPDGEARAAVEAAVLLEAFRINRSGLPGPLLAWQPHLRAVTDAALERRDAMSATLSNSLGRHLQQIGDYRGARVYFEQALTIRQEISNDESLEIIVSLNNLGHLLQEQGDFAVARPYLERAVAVSTRVQGAEHEDTATCLSNLGILLNKQGDLAAARSAFERSLEIREKVLGAEDRATALSLNNLGHLLKGQGDFAGARRYFERALAIQEKVLGPDHPETAISRSHLGLLLKKLGEYAGARLHLEEALAIQEKILGPDHPDTAASRSHLGLLLRDLGDFAGARIHFERALEALEKTLGPEHPETATGLFNIGHLLESQQDDAAARPFYEKALAIDEKALGPEHPDTARCLNSLGVLAKNAGDLAEALRLLTRALGIREKALGAEHPDTAFTLSNRGSVLESLGALGPARASFEKALRIWEKTLGPEHPDLAVTLSNLALLAQRQGDPDAAIEHIARALEIRETSLGPDHPETAFCLNNLGFILFREGEPEGARPCFEKALEIWEATLPPDHPWTAMARRNLEAVGPRKPEKKVRRRKKEPGEPV
jgi:tetratricopeptide (TPR) repeat protein